MMRRSRGVEELGAWSMVVRDDTLCCFAFSLLGVMGVIDLGS